MVVCPAARLSASGHCRQAHSDRSSQYVRTIRSGAQMGTPTSYPVGATIPFDLTYRTLDFKTIIVPTVMSITTRVGITRGIPTGGIATALLKVLISGFMGHGGVFGPVVALSTPAAGPSCSMSRLEPVRPLATLHPIMSMITLPFSFMRLRTTALRGASIHVLPMGATSTPAKRCRSLEP